MKKEIWKDIPGYEGLYQISNWGNVKSLSDRWGNERLLKPSNDNVYYKIGLHKDKKRKEFKIHQLVAMAFLGHIPDGMNVIINHIDNNPLNNHVDNIEIIKKEGTISANRINSSIHKNKPGISWYKQGNKWRTQIRIGKAIHLGLFIDKQEALDMYQKALANIHLYDGDNKKFRKYLTDNLV